MQTVSLQILSGDEEGSCWAGSAPFTKKNKIHSKRGQRYRIHKYIWCSRTLRWPDWNMGHIAVQFILNCVKNIKLFNVRMLIRYEYRIKQRLCRNVSARAHPNTQHGHGRTCLTHHKTLLLRYTILFIKLFTKCARKYNLYFLISSSALCKQFSWIIWYNEVTKSSCVKRLF